MGRETERKFLVAGQGWRQGAVGIQYRQGYLSAAEDCVVRIRTAGELLERHCRRPLIEKIRYTLDFKGMTWEIDEFKRENEGLIVAEVELAEEDQHIEIPEWAGREVSLDPKYRNVNLMTCPYCSWSRKMKMHGGHR